MAEKISNITITKPRRTRNLYNAFTIKPTDVKAARQEAEIGKPEKFFEILDHMRTLDPRLRGDLETRKLAMLSFDHQIIGDSDEQRAFAESVMDEINYQSLASALWDGVYLGLKVVDLNWETVSNKLMPTSFDPMDAKHFLSVGYTLAKQNELDTLKPGKLLDVLLYKNSDGKVAALKDYPAGKLIVMDFSDISYKSLPINFTRMGIGTLCMYLSMLKHYNMQDWGSYNEVFAMAMRLGKYNDMATQPQIDELKLIVSSLGTDAEGVISENCKIEFPEVNRDGSVKTFEALENAVNKNISLAILGETLTSDTGANGNRSLGQVHNGVRMEKIKADANYIQREINRQFIKPLLAYNFGKPDPTVKLVIPVKAELDLEKESRVITELVNAGMPITQAQVRERFQLKEPQDNEAVLQKTQGGLSSLLGGAV